MYGDLKGVSWGVDRQDRFGEDGRVRMTGGEVRGSARGKRNMWLEG